MDSNNATKSATHPSVIYKPSTRPVDTEITVFVLLTGILVGLLLVIVILCVCKFCIKSNKPLKRQQVVFTKYSSDKDFTWNENEKRCTKYRSMEPRWSPASSIIPVDFETGSPGSSLERKQDDKNVESMASRSNFLLPGDRVLPQCSIDNATSQQPTDCKQLPNQSSLTRRAPDEVCLHRSGRCFQNSPPVQRQTSIYVTTSDEHLDKIHQHAIKEQCGDAADVSFQRRRPSASMIALASPEEVSSLEETVATAIILLPPTSQTIISAEIHQVPLTSNVKRQSPSLANREMLLPPPALHTHSHSTGSLVSHAMLDGEETSFLKHPPFASNADLRCENVQIRPSFSVEDERLVLMMENRCRQNSRWLNNRNNWTHRLYDEDENVERLSKTRYNDTGSIEEITSTSDYYQQQLLTTSDLVTEEYKESVPQSLGSDIEMEIDNEIVIELEDDEGDKIDDEPLSLESRKLWALRATFEEEEEQIEAVIISIIDPPPPDDPPPTITTSSLESPKNCSPTNDCDECPEEKKEDEKVDCCTGGTNSTGCRHLPLPSSTSETRRQSYQNLLGTRKCRQKLESKGSSEKDNSFDSIETEGSSTDASRLDVITTSMESTTDNTDSTGEGQIHRLQQMKADSGYKSLETNNGNLSSKIMLGKRQQHVNLDTMDKSVGGCSIEMKTIVTEHQEPCTESRPPLVSSNYVKTASKKRREYTRERQVVETSFGWPPEHEEVFTRIETLPQSSTTHSDFMVDENHDKSSVFLRFFRGGRERSYRPFSRDFSIDEKSDALYQEFSRRDPILDANRCRSPRVRSRHRVYHQPHSVASAAQNVNIENNGGSEGDSPCSVGHHHHRSKVSPEDSIEEEDQELHYGNTSYHDSHGDDEKPTLSDEGVLTTTPHIPVITVAPDNSF